MSRVEARAAVGPAAAGRTREVRVRDPLIRPSRWTIAAAAVPNGLVIDEDAATHPRRAGAAVSVASGAFAESRDAFLTRRALTPAMRDGALMALTGLENRHIAAAHDSAVGDGRAQTKRIDAEAGVTSRSQVMSVFIDDLLAERPVPGVGDDPPRMAS